MGNLSILTVLKHLTIVGKHLTIVGIVKFALKPIADSLKSTKNNLINNFFYICFTILCLSTLLFWAFTLFKKNKLKNPQFRLKCLIKIFSLSLLIQLVASLCTHFFLYWKVISVSVHNSFSILAMKLS